MSDPISADQKPLSYIEKTRALAAKHNLGFLFNPGGGQFLNRETGVNIQITTCDDVKDYYTLLKNLQKLGLESADATIKPQ